MPAHTTPASLLRTTGHGGVGDEGGDPTLGGPSQPTVTIWGSQPGGSSSSSSLPRETAASVAAFGTASSRRAGTARPRLAPASPLTPQSSPAVNVLEKSSATTVALEKLAAFPTLSFGDFQLDFGATSIDELRHEPNDTTAPSTPSAAAALEWPPATVFALEKSA